MTRADYEKLYRQAPCGLISTTPDGLILDANDMFLEWTGYDAGAVVGKNFTAILDAGSQLFFETRHLQVLHLQRKVSEVALTLKCADGSLLPVLVNSVLVHDDGHDVVRTAVFDTTDRLQYESEILHARRAAESSEARVRVLQDVSSAFGVSASDEDVAESFALLAREAFTATECAVHLLDNAGELRLVAGVNPLVGLVPPIAALRNTPTFVIVHADEVESEYPLLAAGLKKQRLESLSIMPLVDGDERLGILVCFFSRRRDFDDQFFDLQRALGRQATQTLVRVRLQRRLEYLALHDQLTGLANRQLLQESLDAAIQASQRAGAPLAVLFLDVDAFKSINDRLGHAAGDDVLRDLADRLRLGVRSGDIVGRIGGDEFVVICADADLVAAMSIAQRILDVVRHPIIAAGVPVAVSVSAGVVTYTPDVDPRPTPDELLIRADGAMYSSKDAGKDRVTVAPDRPDASRNAPHIGRVILPTDSGAQGRP